MESRALDAETNLQARICLGGTSAYEQALHRLTRLTCGLAISMAGKIQALCASMNDLVKEAGLGLMKAADKLILIAGLRFSTYAVGGSRRASRSTSCANLVDGPYRVDVLRKNPCFQHWRPCQARLEREGSARAEHWIRHQLRQMDLYRDWRADA